MDTATRSGVLPTYPPSGGLSSTSCVTCGPAWRGRCASNGRDRTDRQVHALVSAGLGAERWIDTGNPLLCSIIHPQAVEARLGDRRFCLLKSRRCPRGGRKEGHVQVESKKVHDILGLVNLVYLGMNRGDERIAERSSGLDIKARAAKAASPNGAPPYQVRDRIRDRKVTGVVLGDSADDIYNLGDPGAFVAQPG